MLLALPSSAVAGTYTWTAGSVSATLSWKGDRAEPRKVRIAIDRSGTRVFDEKLRADACKQHKAHVPCPGPRDMRVRDLDGDSEPEVIISAFTGRRLCCAIAIVYRWTGSGYEQSEHNFRETGFGLEDLDDDGTKDDFPHRDARFLFLYGSLAESVFPVQVFVFDHGTFIDATHAFPDVVKDDARAAREQYERRAQRRHRVGVRAALAAYVADLYTLDRVTQAERVLDKALGRGLLERYSRSDTGPFGRKFIDDLKRHLRRFGYA